ncbi:hypothetical protein SCP_0210210 [Sparassis crispa]|uniref:Uncharacterized protein n=1 Tax=Sparassis crispa TaxID=139825 RepID=A0A401GCD2_9APHY|nr:hypothetical protein SCP_0210210 [Sparassis crispa]GBE79820.1 hypothetical protein SCP_0210210 [Sparassis crispa]
MDHRRHQIAALGAAYIEHVSVSVSVCLFVFTMSTVLPMSTSREETTEEEQFGTTKRSPLYSGISKPVPFRLATGQTSKTPHLRLHSQLLRL